MNDREKFVIRAALIYLQSNRDDVNMAFANDCPYCGGDCPDEILAIRGVCSDTSEYACDGWAGDPELWAKDFQALSVNGDEGELIKEDEVANLLMTLQ